MVSTGKPPTMHLTLSGVEKAQDFPILRLQVGLPPGPATGPGGPAADTAPSDSTARNIGAGPEPGPDLGILVVGSVVLDQDRPLPAIAARQLFPKGQVAPRVEDRVLAVRETRAPQFDGAQDLDAVALSRDRDFGRLDDAAPGGLPSRVLSEAGFVGKNQRPVFRAGFFLRLG